MKNSILETIGLSEKEATLYELLLESGEKPAGVLAARAHMKRASAYHALYGLQEKGLVSSREKGKKIHFRLEPPDRLVAMADREAHRREQAKNDLLAMIPAYMSAYVLSVEKPIVTMFEGVKGLKEIYQDTLREKKPIYAVLTTAVVEPELFRWLTTSYGKIRAQKNIKAQVIVSSGTWVKEYEQKNSEELRETIQVPHSLFPFQHEVDIYGNKVAFINYKKGEPLIGVVIHNEQIAKTMKAWFDLAWRGAQSVGSSGTSA